MSYLGQKDKRLTADVRSTVPDSKGYCLFSMHSIETLLNQWLAEATSSIGMDLSTKSVGNSSIRHKTAQEMCAQGASLIDQGLSVHMPALGTLLSTKNVHTLLLSPAPEPGMKAGAAVGVHCSKMTLGNFAVLDQALSVLASALHTILSTKSVHKASWPSRTRAASHASRLAHGVDKVDKRPPGGLSALLPVSMAAQCESFEINGLVKAVQASSHCYPQKM